MDAVSNDLTRPLGVDGPAPTGGRARVPATRILAGALLAAAAAAGLYVALANDPIGGEPYALVPIEIAGRSAEPAPEGPRQAPETPPPAAAETRASAGEVEARSGVAVVRPGGAAAPSSVIIQVPDAPAGAARSALEQPLLERSRYGFLPKVGADGARAAKVYARPPGALPDGSRPAARVALVIGGLGIGAAATTEAVAKLPAPVTLAFTPYGGDLERHVAQAREDGHEVLLQAPMEPFDYPDNDPGPHTLTARAKTQDNIARLQWAMGRFTGYVGVINFMGARLTADEAALTPILREIGARGLVFVDDGSSSRSLAEPAGAAAGTPTARADLVLDGVPRPDAIDRQLERLEQIARQKGFALASAGALPVTVDRVAHWAKTLAARGILLVPASAAFADEGRR